jgi:hypothetical protein
MAKAARMPGQNVAKLNNDQFGGKRPNKPRIKSAVTQDESTFKGKQTKRRNQFEASPDGKARMDTPIKPQGSMSMADTYKMRGFTDDAPHPMGQQELPGMSSLKDARASGLVSAKGGQGAIPDVEKQPKWEDMHPTAQAHVLRQAAMYGVTKSSAHASFGSQLDQSYARAEKHSDGGDVHPAGATFYSHTGETHNTDGSESTSMTPRGRLVTSAKKNDVPMSAQVLANAQTSPKSVFQRTPKTGKNKGQTIYPNDLNASAAINHVQMGNDPKTSRAVPGVGGMHGNNMRAANAYKQQSEGNHTVDELTHPSGAKILGPKTGSYHGAWTSPHNSTGNLTSDIHTGGGGFAPHLGLKEREDYLGIQGIHALHDHVARQEMAKRGLNSIHHAQAAQWGEERINRGLQKEHEAYGDSHGENRMVNHKQFHQETPGQEGLF